MQRRVHALALVLLTTLATSCALMRSAETPIASDYLHYQNTNSTLVVLLHGRGGSIVNFLSYGAVEQVRACNPGANIVGVDSHFGYYRERILAQRLREDVIGPARRNGIRQVWILGVSLGGLGGLIYRQNYPDDIDAVVLMAPYLGDWKDLETYLQTPAAAREQPDSDFAEIWSSIESSANQQPRLTLAFGEDDSFNRQHQWLAGLLDRDSVTSSPGGHNWYVWRKLWPETLRRSGLCEQT